MSEVQKAEIPLREFGQQRFVAWLRERTREGTVPEEHLAKATKLPYIIAVQRFNGYFRDFVEQTVSDRIKSDEFKINHIEISGQTIVPKIDPYSELTEHLLEASRREYGISGMVPRRFISAIFSGVRSGIKDLQLSMRKETEHQERLRRHGGRVSEQTMRIACLVCRELESLTNLLVEMIYYSLNKSFSEININAKTSWYDRIKFLRSFPYHKSISTLHEAVVGNSNPVSLHERGLVSLLEEIRNIRNKIAHPANLQTEHIASLIELSEHVLKKLSCCAPILARIAEVRLCTSGIVQLGLHLEVDYHKKLPRVVLFEDSLNLGLTIGDLCVNKEVIVAPVNLIGGKCEIEKDFPIILPRKEDIVLAMHEPQDKDAPNMIKVPVEVDVPVIIYYSETQLEGEYVSEKYVEEEVQKI